METAETPTPLPVMSVGKTIFKNTIWLTVAEGISSILKFTLLIYAAHVLGDTGFGKFTFALSVVSLFSVLLDAGLNQIVIREFAKSRESERFFPALFTLQVFLGLLAVLVISIVAFFASEDSSIRWMIGILGVYLALNGFVNIFFSAFRARQKMEYEILPRLVQSSIAIGLGFAALAYYRSGIALSVSYAIAGAGAMIASLWLFQSKIAKIHWAFDPSTWKDFLKMSFSLALLSGLASVIYNNLDSSMLGFFGDLTENGWYNAAYKIIVMVLMPMSILAQSFFPALSVAHSKSPEEFQKLWNREVGLMILIGLPMAVGGVLVAPQMIAFLYPKEYEPAAKALQMLLVAAFFIYLHHCFHHALIVVNRQMSVFWIFLVGVLSNLALNFFLIPRYSLYGAAAGQIATHAFILLALGILVARRTTLRPLHPEIGMALLLSGISATSMGFAMKALALPLLPSIAVGIGVYFVCHYLLRMLRNLIPHEPTR